jgi:hypothetical protein
MMVVCFMRKVGPKFVPEGSVGRRIHIVHEASRVEMTSLGFQDSMPRCMSGRPSVFNDTFSNTNDKYTMQLGP